MPQDSIDTVMETDAVAEGQPDASADQAQGESRTTPGEGGNSGVPKQKRLACIVCRKRKLKCDGNKPSCSTCSRLGHNCAYDEVRKKSGPKRGYVKALEERLKLLETLLRVHDIGTSPTSGESTSATAPETTAKQAQPPAPAPNFSVTDPSIGIASSRDRDRWHFTAESPQNGSIDDFNFNTNMTLNMNNLGNNGNANNFTWEMIGLGLEEPLPPQETIDELHQIYFEKIHPSLPMVHKYRYLAAMNLAPTMRPPVCLRYAMWTLACSVTDKYQDLKDLFYQRSRKYVEVDYIKGFGEHIISVSHVQTHVLLASYEFKMMYFPRAWISTGSAVRLCQMISLHRLDGPGLDVKQCLPPPRDWTEREERRRTFWMAFCEDRYASIGTGWPMIIDEKDILTNLPASDSAFEMSRPEETQTLEDAMSPSGAGKLSPFGGVVLMACLFGRNLVHLHRPDADDRDHDIQGEFWKRHRNMDNILLNTSLCLPASLKFPAGLNDPNAVFTTMCIHTSTICLHQAAIFKADKNKLPASMTAESKLRCITAANEIASVMRMISHLDLTGMNPFISFCLYVGARVFVQYLKSKPDDSQTADSLRFLLMAMNALKRRNPLTESFLVQLDVDLEALGTRIPKLKSAFPRSSDSPTPHHQAPDAPRGANCEPATSESPHNGAKGIMSYRNDCSFVKPGEGDGSTPDMIEVDPGSGMSRISHTPGSSGLGSQGWTSVEQPTTLPTRERSSGSSYVPLHGLMPVAGFAPGDIDGGPANDMAGTPPDRLSNDQTPNSTGVPDQRQTLAPGSTLGSSGRGSFETSPAPSHQNLSMAGATTQAEVDQNVGSYFGGHSSFGLPPGVSPNMAPNPRFPMPEAPGGGFGVGSSWADISNQQGVTPVAEGVFRSMMPMGPVDSVDLGWDTNP